MQNEKSTVVGIFSDITDARRAVDELHGSGVSTARLVENELAVTFTGTAEREGASHTESVSDAHHRTGGIKGFFARLFGWDESRTDWQLSSDTESYFRDAYDKKHHLIIIDDCRDISLARSIITRMGGVVEERGHEYYHSGRGTSDDQAADSGLGRDVDRMPFARTTSASSSSQDERSVSDRLSASGVSGTADRIPFTGSTADVNITVGRTDEVPGVPKDTRLGTGLAVPSAHQSLSGQPGDQSPIVSGDRLGSAERGPKIVGDDRIHDRGVSNADVARLSSDRIMELDDEDEHLVDADTEALESEQHHPGGQEQTLDNGHILPDRSFPPRGHETVHPAP